MMVGAWFPRETGCVSFRERGQKVMLQWRTGTIRRRIENTATWQALDRLAKDRMESIQELAPTKPWATCYESIAGRRT